MKKNPDGKRITLRKETLRHLEEGSLAEAKGGMTPSLTTIPITIIIIVAVVTD